MARPRTVILTVSDRCSRGETVDTSGPALALLCGEKLSADVLDAARVPDERDCIAETLRGWAGSTTRPDLILTTSGAGLAQRWRSAT